MTNKTRSINPCPFCGSRALYNGEFAECSNGKCGMFGPTAATEQDAIDKWNSISVSAAADNNPVPVNSLLSDSRERWRDIALEALKTNARLVRLLVSERHNASTE